MMKQEFEQIAKIKVSEETFTKIIVPMYLSTNLSKRAFVKILNLKALAVLEKKEKDIRKMCIRDRSGCSKTPNGCYYHIRYVEWIGVDIATAKYIIAPLMPEDLQKLAENEHDLHLDTSFDFDYTQCIDSKKYPINL